MIYWCENLCRVFVSSTHSFSRLHTHAHPHTLSHSFTLFLLFSFKPYVPVRTAKVIDRIALAKDDEKALHSEVSILQKLTHKNVVNCCDFYIEEKKYYLVLEYMEGGELFDRIVKKSFYNEGEAREVVETLLSAIEYCHSHNIVHRWGNVKKWWWYALYHMVIFFTCFSYF